MSRTQTRTTRTSPSTGWTDDAERELLEHQAECTFIWSNKEGFPVGVIMNYVFRDGRFWLTASGQRARVAAVRRDPRVSIAVSSLGSGIKTRKSLTYKGRCIVHDDEETKAWFYPRSPPPCARATPQAAGRVRAAPRLAAPGRVRDRARGPHRLRQHADVARHPGRGRASD